MARYAAFLRGINVGGHKLIKMEELNRIFTSFKFTNVKTLIASGNVLFDTKPADEEKLVKKIQDGLQKELGYEVKTMVRSLDDIEAMLKLNPFKKLVSGKDVKLYVTLLPAPTTSKLKTPYKDEKNGFEIIKVNPREVYTIAYRLPEGRYGEMSFIEKEFGKHSTTRNWNTIGKLVP